MDVTENITKEQETQKMLKEALDMAQAASQSKSTFLFNMSHDIRTPMNAIIGFTDMAKKNLDNKAKAEDCLDKVSASSEQLLGIINDVLDMARIENGKVELEENPVNSQESLQALLYLITPLAAKKHIAFVSEIDSASIQHCEIWCDTIRVNRVLLNILTNAIKYTPNDGQVRFAVKEVPSPQNGYARYHYEITDNGIGMSEDFQKHVFEAFTRERNSTLSHVQGTGLGLAISKSLVDLMKGDIRFESKLGMGTKVVLELDFRIAKKSEIATNILSDAQTETLAGKRVLLVEDNELNREIGKELLEGNNMVVEEAVDGSQAVEKVLEKYSSNSPDKYDVILMDIQMPIMDGYKATGEILNIPGFKQHPVPIIALSANAFEEDRKKSLDAGMTAHIAKPIKVKELLETLQKILV